MEPEIKTSNLMEHYDDDFNVIGAHTKVTGFETNADADAYANGLADGTVSNSEVPGGAYCQVMVLPQRASSTPETADSITLGTAPLIYYVLIIWFQTHPGLWRLFKTA